jgi:cyclic pyranopterin phosphate synthase
MPEVDLRGRPLASLRVSVTDRCNLRCSYCMPEQEYHWLPRSDLLSFEEICSLVDVFCSLGVDEVRLTGGEPLLRRGLPNLVARLAGKPLLRDLALTTNGVLLADQAQDLAHAGLKRVTVSLDTLRPSTFEALTRRDELAQVLEGIRAARRWMPRELKLDSVILRGRNDGEILDLLEFAKEHGAEVRFIEYMDVPGATGWSADQVVSRRELLARIAERHGTIEPLDKFDSAPARRYRLSDGTVFGVIASTTEPFCDSCDRSRLTADGMWFLCLYARVGLDLRRAMRAGVPAAELAEKISATWGRRSDRGAVDRLGLAERGPSSHRSDLASNPHLEMHKRGG